MSKKKMFLEILQKDLYQYGFKIYKGRIWRYSPHAGFVYYIDVQTSSWGDLNEVFIYTSSFQSPITTSQFGKDNVPLLCTGICCANYQLKETNTSIFNIKCEDSQESFEQQLRVLYPYIINRMYPFLCVDNTIESYLSKIEPMHNIYYEITTGVEGGLGNDLALEYFRIGDISNAYRILERKIQFCSTVINRVLSGDVIQQRNQKDKLVSYWRGEQKLAESLLSEMKNEQSSIKDMIEKNICSSKQACALFFKRF